MNTTLTVDRKKYIRLANRIPVKAIETEQEYDHIVAAVEELIDRGEDNLSPEESALVETMAILIQAYDDRHYPLPEVPLSLSSAGEVMRVHISRPLMLVNVSSKGNASVSGAVG